MHSSGPGYGTGSGMPSLVPGRSDAAGPGVVQGTTPSPPWPMTQEQVEMLRRQIFVFKVISRRLADTFRSTHQSDIDWTPTSDQNEILERIFGLQDGFTRTPQRVKEISAALCSKGPHVHNAEVLLWLQERQSRQDKLETSGKQNSEDNERKRMRDEHAQCHHPENWDFGDKRQAILGEASASHEEGGGWPSSNKRQAETSVSHEEGGEWISSAKSHAEASASYQQEGESAPGFTESLLFQTCLLHILTGAM